MKIAIIDGDPRFRSGVRMMLEARIREIGIYGWKLELFSSAEEFLDNWKDQFKVIISETALPGQNGIELARTIRKKNPLVPIIYFSENNDFAMESYEVGAADYIQKPITADKVQRMLQRLIRLHPELDVAVKLPDGYHFQPRDLYYVQYSSHRCTLYFTQNETHLLYLPLEQLGAILANFEHFVLASQNVLVNVNRAKALTPTSILMQNGHYVSVTKHRMDDVRAAFHKTQYLGIA